MVGENPPPLEEKYVKSRDVKELPVGGSKDHEKRAALCQSNLVLVGRVDLAEASAVCSLRSADS